MIEAESLHYSSYHMASSFLHMYVHIQYTHLVGTPFCDKAAHHSHESIYTTSTDQFLAG